MAHRSVLRVAAGAALFALALGACSSDADTDLGADAPPVTGADADADDTTTTVADGETTTTADPADDDDSDDDSSGCGVTLADVQALLPADSGVTENSTPDPFRCNFTWDDGGPRGIDVARVVGGRSEFESSSAAVPNGPDTLADGTPYEVVDLGDQGWAFAAGNAVNVVVLVGDDVVVADVVNDGAPTDGPQTPTGMDAEFLEICTTLVELALG